MSPSARILVNGATGALGRATLAALEGRNVVAGTRRPQSPIAGSIYIPEDGCVAPESLTGIDVIINCAGRVTGTEAEITAANVDHVRNLAHAARIAGVKRFVQVSSFSIFGEIDCIGSNMPFGPVTAYGHSKMEAEKVLGGNNSDGLLSTLSLRLPFMFDRNKPALLGPLIKLFRRTPIFPVAPYPVYRSMLTYLDAATRLTEAALLDQQGVANVADPLPFTTDMLIALMRENGLHAPRPIAIPKSAVHMVNAFAPAIGRRLFASSRLADEANWAIDRPFIGITAELQALLGQYKTKG